jgi:hypothetical protein
VLLGTAEAPSQGAETRRPAAIPPAQAELRAAAWSADPRYGAQREASLLRGLTLAGLRD